MSFPALFMAHRNEASRIGKTASGKVILILGLFSLGTLARAEDVHEVPNHGTAAEHGGVEDLTGLTLDELYNLDIVQLNVLGGHTHYAGQLMFAYEFMYSDSDGYKSGSSSVSDADVLASGVFKNIHTEMTMEMHMFDFMYAPTDRVTLSAMLSWNRMKMEHLDTGGERFNTKSEGFGDLKLMGLLTILGDVHEGGARLILNTGVSVPTGSVEQSDRINGKSTRLEYPMQTGTGTWDPIVGVTYLDGRNNFSWGAQGLTYLRFGTNESGYRFGNQLRFTAWGAYALTDWFAPYLRVEGNYRDNVHGQDPRINPTSNPESVPDFQGGTELDLILGANLYSGSGLLKGHRLMIEGGVPIYQDLDGPQLSLEWFIRTAWSISF